MLLLMLCSLITLAALSTATAARSTTASTATTDVTSRPKLRVTVTSTAGLQCGSAGPYQFVGHAWEAACGMKGGGYPKLPVQNHSYACRVFPNVVPAVHTPMNASLAACDINPVGNTTCKTWNPPDAVPEHRAHCAGGGPSGGPPSRRAHAQ